VDITFHREFATLLGFTEAEIRATYRAHIELLARLRGVSEATVLADLAEWYNGYCFTTETPAPAEMRLYNPVSVSSYFYRGEFQPYWIGTGQLQVGVLSREAVAYARLAELEGRPLEMSVTMLGGRHALEYDRLSAATFDDERLQQELLVMAQAGYLTIDPEQPSPSPYGAVRLRIPNKEVRDYALEVLCHLLPAHEDDLVTMRKCLVKGDARGAVDHFLASAWLREGRKLFASLEAKDAPALEAQVSALFSALALCAANRPRGSLEGLDFDLSAETRIGGGRADAVLGTLPRDAADGTLTVIEFKCVLGGGAAVLADAMRKAFIQCDDKYSKLSPEVLGARRLRFLVVVVREEDGQLKDVSTRRDAVGPALLAELAEDARALDAEAANTVTEARTRRERELRAEAEEVARLRAARAARLAIGSEGAGGKGDDGAGESGRG